MTETSVGGFGLHSGAPVRVVLRGRPGPVTLAASSFEARVDQLAVALTARATTVEAFGGRLRVGTVEHAFAALAGLGVYDGVGLWVDGPEMPLLDGGAAAWIEAIDRVAPEGYGATPAGGPAGLAPAAPRLRVLRAAVLAIGASRYEFACGEGVHVGVRVEFEGFDSARLAPEASWSGDAGDFRARIAPARTFALARDVEELARAGLARHVDPASVVVLAPDAVHAAGRPFAPDEPARHKLLDLVGDLYLHGGPPRGTVRAVRPGHAASAQALLRARAEGIVGFD